MADGRGSRSAERASRIKGCGTRGRWRKEERVNQRIYEVKCRMMLSCLVSSRKFGGSKAVKHDR